MEIWIIEVLLYMHKIKQKTSFLHYCIGGKFHWANVLQ